MAASYLVQTRNGVFYARFVVPLAMRDSGSSVGREIRISTLTKDPRDAIARARLLRVLYEGLTFKGGVFSREHVTTHFKKIMAQFKAPPPGTPKFNVEYDFATGKATFSDVKADEQVTVMSMLDDMQKRLPVPVQQIATAPRNSTNLSEEANQPIAVMVKQYLEYQKGRENAGEIGPKNVPQQATRLGLFIKYFDGKMIGELTPNDIKIYMDDIAYYPTSRDVVGIEPGKTVREVIALSKAKKLRKPTGETCPTLAKLTVKGYIHAVANFMEFCDLKLAVMDRTASRMKSIVDAAPQGPRNVKEPFNDHELTQIFSCSYFWQPAYNHPHQYWTPVIGLFTGARLSEICQLTTADISEYEKGKWQISFNDDEDNDDEDGTPKQKKQLKNKTSRRIIPMHPKLVELGLVDFWKKRKKIGNVNLMNVSRAKKDGFGKVPGDFFRNKILREYVGIHSKKKVFHSFRYTFITRLRQAIIDHAGKQIEENIENYPEGLTLRQMVGHSVASSFTRSMGKSDVHIGTYMGEISMESRERLLNRLNFENIALPKYKDVRPGQRIRYTNKKIESPVNENFGITSETFSRLF